MGNPKFKHRFLKSELFKLRADELDAWREVDELKKELDAHPLLGKVIRNGEGLRKVRMKLPGRGKRGGARVIYFQVVNDRILLLDLYAKNEQEDVTPDELKMLIRVRDNMLEGRKEKGYEKEST